MKQTARVGSLRIGPTAPHCTRSISVAKFIFLVATSIAVSPAQSQEVIASQEYDKKLSAAGAAPKLGGFGEKVSLSTGQTSFSSIDIDIPGNDALPVQFARRLNITERHLPEELGGLGNWDLDVPYIEGTFSKNVGWAISSDTTNRYKRCSRPSEPLVEGVMFSPTDVWHGYNLHLPGQDDEVLMVDTAGNIDPTSGGPYPWIVRSHGRVSCLTTPLKNGYPGEGFVLHTTEGTKYFFDYPIERNLPTLLKGPKGLPGYSMQRKRVFLLATRIEDRFGNYVNYQYTNDLLSSVSSSDGRLITVQHSPSSVVATAGERTWNYSIVNGHLASVTNPDGSKWQYTPFGSLSVRGNKPSDILSLDYFDPDYMCSGVLDGDISGPFSFQVTHPSGATSAFGFQEQRFYRSQVPYACVIDFFDHQTRVSGGSSPFTATGNIDWNLVARLVGGGEPGEPSISDFLNAVREAQEHYESTGLIEELTEVSGFAHIANANYYDVYSLTSQSISGPGIGTRQTTYQYEIEPYPYCNQISPSTGVVLGTSCDQPPCAFGECVDGVGRWTVTTRPGGDTNRRRFGVIYGKNEGVLLEERVVSANGTVQTTVANQYMTDGNVVGQTFQPDMGIAINGDPMVSRVRPIVLSITSQDSASFNTRYYDFDAFARPQTIDRWSAGVDSPLGRTDATSYYDHLGLWVIGNVARSTNANTGLVESETLFSPTTALPVEIRKFGKTIQSYSYNADGTLATVKDGNNNVSSLSSWYRGVPRTIQHPPTPESPSGAIERAVVNSHGWITAATDENEFTTDYGYDEMGRLESIVYPVGDTVPWQSVAISFQPINADEHGLAPGHWRSSRYEGNKHLNVYYDALWQPILEETLDASDIGNTLSQVVNRFDAQGRQIFKSYPQRGVGNYTDITQGFHTEYDVLNRITSVSQDSELGLLTTITEYLPGFKTRITNPRGQQTTTSYQVLDAPTFEYPALIQGPEGTTTAISRDIFGKPLMISR